MVDLSFLSYAFEFMFLLKIGIAIILFLYLIFSVVIERQVKTMNDIVYINNQSPLVHTIALIHVVFSLSLFIASLVIL